MIYLKLIKFKFMQLCVLYSQILATLVMVVGKQESEVLEKFPDAEKQR